MNSKSPQRTSGPPLASSWAAPPEFYIDENLAGRTIRRALSDLGYVVHTPAQLYGSRVVAEGTPDEVWLRDVGKRGWVALARDSTILATPHELAAYKAARIHLVLFDGRAARIELIATMHALLRDICAEASNDTPAVWRARGGRNPYLEKL